jgi:hypothetical protein
MKIDERVPLTEISENVSKEAAEPEKVCIK